MGIKGLWQVINKKYPHLNKSIPQGAFRGKRIAIDVGSFFFNIRSGVRTSVIYQTNVLVDAIDETEVDSLWIQKIMRCLLGFMVYGITPILVFDGPSPHQKTKTKIKRNKDREKVLGELAELNEAVEKMGEAKKILVSSPDLLERKRKLMSRLSSVSAESYRYAYNFFRGAGFPVLTSTEEAERLGAALCREGIAAALYTADGDGLTHGAPILIRDVGEEIYDEFGSGKASFEFVHLREVLEALGFQMAEFVDMCIISGCDYNETVPKIAIGTAMKLIREYGSIEAIPLSVFLPPKIREKYGIHDISCLDHLESRKLFAHKDSESMIDPEFIREGMYDFQTPTPETWEHFRLYDMGMYTERYILLLQDLPPPRRHYHITRVIHDVDWDILEGEVLLGERVITQRYSTSKRESNKKYRAMAAASTPSY